jgi:hypothetical protein
MNAKMRDLVRHREQLIHRAATQREELRFAYFDLKDSIGLARIAANVFRLVKTYPGAVVSLAALLLGASQGKLTKLPKKLGLGWTALHLLHSWLSSRER